MGEKFTIEMTKDEMLKLYENKIVVDGIKQSTEFNTIVSLNDYGDGINLSIYKNEILQLLYKDERLADVQIDNDLNIDMVFYTSYCPYYYEDSKYLDEEDEKKYLSNFTDYSVSRVNIDGYVSVRKLIEDFTNTIKNKQEDFKDDVFNALKKNIINTGFIDKYIDDNQETFVTLKNVKEFERLLEQKINILNKQAEEEEEF